MQRKEIIPLLEEKKYDEIVEIAKKNIRGIFRLLIGITFDKSDILCWRAVEATGIIAGEIAKTNPEVIRNLAQRLLWMLRDESGNNLSSAPEMLGEIVRNSPDTFADIAPVIASFHDELMLRPGVLRAIFRIGEVRPDLISVSGEFLEPYLRDEDPVVRAYALLIAGAYKLAEPLLFVSALKDDGDAVTLYSDGDFISMSVGEIAAKIHERFSEEEN
jgi:HEAT repeat protein